MSDIALLPQVEAFLGRHHALFIDGGYVESQSNQTLDVVNPATGQVIAQVSDATHGDIGVAWSRPAAASSSGPKRLRRCAAMCCSS